MKIIILGAGRVGESVAEQLVSEQNEITIIDHNADMLSRLQERFDLRGVVGNGIDPAVLAVQTHECLLEFQDVNLNKAVGLTRLTQAQGVPLKSIIAFGDNDNDV